MSPKAGKPTAEGSGRSGGILAAARRALTIVLIVAAILLGFGVVAARTTGFRDLLKDAIRERTGVAVSIGGSRIGLPYDLVLSDVVIPADGSGGTNACRVGEIRVGWRWPTELSVHVTGAMLRLSRVADGEWMPAAFAGLGDVRDAADLSEVTAPFRTNLILVIEGSAVAWDGKGRKGPVSLRVDQFTMRPLRLPNRVLYHYYLAASDLAYAGGPHGVAEMREWLVSDDKPYLELMRLADTAGAAGMAPANGHGLRESTNEESSVHRHTTR